MDKRFERNKNKYFFFFFFDSFNIKLQNNVLPLAHGGLLCCAIQHMCVKFSAVHHTKGSLSTRLLTSG